MDTLDNLTKPAMTEKPLTPDQQEEIRKKLAARDEAFKQNPVNTYHGIKVHDDIRRAPEAQGNEDRDWVRRSFSYVSSESNRVSDLEANVTHAQKRLGRAPRDIEMSAHTRSYRSFIDTSLGGNFPINTEYGYTEFADINVDRAHNVGFGMGRFYQETIENNAHDIQMRFGTQKFNTGLVFFGNWFDYYSYCVSKYGRAPSGLYTMGSVIGITVGLMAPQLFLLGWMAKWATVLQGNKFWYVNPTMSLYWNAVNNIFSELTGSMAITTPTTYKETLGVDDGSGDHRSVDKDVRSWLPSVYSVGFGNGSYTLDVRRVAHRAQLLHNKVSEVMMKSIGGSADSEKLKNIYDQAMATYGNGGVANMGQSRYHTNDLLKMYFGSGAGRFGSDQENLGATLDEKNPLVGKPPPEHDSMQDIYAEPSFAELLQAEVDEGSGWLTLRVNGTGSVSESFSNSSTESQLSQLINGWAATRKQLEFNFAGGSLFGDLAKSAIDGVKDTVAGGLSAVGLSAVSGFLFGAKIDIPDTFDSSSISFPTRTYSLKLRTPYNHPLAIAQDLYLPIACLMAGVLPLSQGRSAYGPPFYCELYDRGRCIVRNGLIESVNIERGTGNVAWTPDGLPLGVDITFTVKNLDKVMHMPLFYSSIDESTGSIERLFLGSDNAFSDYISVLAGLSLPDILYRSSNTKRQFNNLRAQWNAYWDKDQWAQRVANSSPVRFISNFIGHTARR